WRGWYPRSLRRPGDLWDRLAPELRRFRHWRSVVPIWAFGICLPFSPPPRNWMVRAGPILAFAGLFWLLKERRRVEKFVRAQTNMSVLEASAVLTLPPWRTATWHRLSATRLLDTKRTVQKKTPPDSEVPTHW